MDAAVGPDGAELAFIFAGRGHGFREPLHDGAMVVRVDDLEKQLAVRLGFRRKAQQRVAAGVGREPVGGQVPLPGAQFGRVEGQPQPFLRRAARRFSLMPLGNVGDGRLAERQVGIGFIDGQAVQLHDERPSVLGEQINLSRKLLPPAGAALDVFQKGGLIALGDEISQRIADEQFAFGGEHLGAGQIDFLNISIFVERGVAQGREVVEIDVAVAVAFELLLDAAEFLVAGFQFARWHSQSFASWATSAGVTGASPPCRRGNRHGGWDRSSRWRCSPIWPAFLAA